MTKLALAAGAAFIVLVAIAVLAFSQPSHTSTATPTGFDLPALNGSARVRLQDFKGKPVVVNLFASWCAECRVELPEFASEARELKGRVQFIGIDSMETGDGSAMARQYGLAAAGFALARDVGPGGSALHDQLEAPGMPVTVFYDVSGKIIAKDIESLPPAALATQLHQLYGV